MSNILKCILNLFHRNPQSIIDAARPFWNGESVFPAQSKIESDVFLLSFGTMKGLEFDIVILPRIGRIKKQPFAETNPDADKNVIYTAMTRAKEELHIFAWHDKPADKYIDAEATVWKNRQFFQIA